MNETTAKTSYLSRWFRLCPVRHSLTLCGLLLIGGYFLLRPNAALMQRICDGFVRPYHRLFSRLFSALPFSVGEALIALGVLAGLGYLVYFLICMICRPGRGVLLYRFLLTCAAAFCMIYGGFCLLWGVYYDCADFEEKSGINGAPASVEQLETVTRYFTDLVNAYDQSVQRDADGCFICDRDVVLDRSAALYDAVAAGLPCLDGDALRAKPFFFSRILSRLNFTGFFFPFTGEANINVDSPVCLFPSTVAHELAHQRGVAEEDESNFVAVLASLENGDADFCYSACLMAYIHLGNALYKASPDGWAENYARLADGPKADLQYNNAYWAALEGPVGKVSDQVYSGFLESYGQTLGLKTYGKCVDLLIAYYYDVALEATRQ